jgi:hypothetical protein
VINFTYVNHDDIYVLKNQYVDILAPIAVATAMRMTISGFLLCEPGKRLRLKLNMMNIITGDLFAQHANILL